jgi:phosphoribosyl-ATP pyrophosphohydrolase
MRPLDQLEQTIAERQAAAATESSYTAKLLAAGVAKIGSKITEEAAEVVEAAAEAGEPGRLHTVREAADLVYHLMVMLRARQIPLSEVESELARRFNMSGLDEKASRAERQS